jgi:integrase
MGQTRKRSHNRGLRKICGCQRRTWPKCSHSWHFNFKPKGGPGYRFSVDSEAAKHVESKGDAEGLADSWRSQIRAGTFRRRTDVPPTPDPIASADAVTFNGFVEKYVERCEPPVSANDRGCLRRFSAFVVDGGKLGDTVLESLTEDSIEMFFASLRKAGRAASTRNKFIQAIKAALRWATKKGYVTRNPIAEAEGLTREKHAQRDRRLVPDVLDEKGKITQEGEERRLMAVASPHLQRLIVGAVESCCRRGELLALQWRDVDLSKRELYVRAEEDGAKKTGVGRRLPISARLSAVLDMARTATETMLRSGPAKGLRDAEVSVALGRCYVFGDEAGLKVGNFKRAWETAVLKAHDHAPQWTKKNKALTAESRGVLDSIDLHFHDLRHEGGSRLLEAGWPLHHVQHMLGHTNLAQTSTYLNATRVGLQESMRRFEGTSGPDSGTPHQTPATDCEVDPATVDGPTIN